MLGNSLLNKLWIIIITGCIVSLILCSIVVSSTSWKQCGEGTGDVSLSVELVDMSSTAGRPQHCRSCCPLEKLSLASEEIHGIAFRASSLALLFSLSFCCLVNSAFSCRFSEQILS